MAVHREIEAYSVDKHVFSHTNGGNICRKGWEWTQCVYGLKHFGLLTGSAAGLGVGAGREPVIFYLADRIDRVAALDLYGNEQWSRSPGQEASSDIVEHPERWCPKTMSFSRIEFINGSGTDLPFQDDTFDFCWSLSSIEHFGGHEAAAVSMREMDRVTKPGGIVAVATEFLLVPEARHSEYFNRSDLEQYIITASPNLHLASEIDWLMPPLEYLIDSIVLPQGAGRRRRHVVLNDGDVQWTSILMFLRKDA